MLARSRVYPDAACITAIFIMVVSSAVLAHDASARASDVSMGIAVCPIGWIYSGPFENWETFKLRPRSISVQPMREKVKSLKHVKLHKQQNTLQLTTIMKLAVTCIVNHFSYVVHFSSERYIVYTVHMYS